jgi:quercetin dioxygenase-like cupin family protein
VNEIPLPNGSWSKMVLTGDSVSGIVSSLGYSVFTPGAEMAMVSHEVEEVAFVVAGAGELRTEQGAIPFTAGDAIHIAPRLWHSVVNTGDVDVIMVFGFPYPAYPPTDRK